MTYSIVNSSVVRRLLPVVCLGTKKGGRSPLSNFDLVKPYLVTTKRLLLKPLAVLVTTV